MPHKLALCGTTAAYRRHLREGETPCDPCREAARNDMRRWSQENRDRRKAGIPKKWRQPCGTPAAYQRHMRNHEDCVVCRDAVRVAVLRRRVVKKFNMTVDQYQSILDDQGGVCAICREESVRGWHVDHDHSCCPGKSSCGRCVRGLLCSRCNPALGAFKDNIGRLEAAIAYLRKYEVSG